MFQAKYPLSGSGILLQEAFASETELCKNGLTPTNISFSEGSGTWNGTTSYIQINRAFEWLFQQSFQLSFRLRPTDGQPSDSMMLCGVLDATANNRIECFILSNGKIRFNYQANGGMATADTANAIFADGQETFHTITCIANASIGGIGGLKIYHNGNECTLDITNDGNTSGITFANFDNTHKLYLGARNNNTVADKFFAGAIDYFTLS